MLFSHRFGSAESLSRARYWMTQLGFEIAPSNPETHDAARLSFRVNLSQSSALLALIDSIEGTNPEGWPSMTEPSRKIRADHTQDSSEIKALANTPERTPIGWHKRDDSNSADPVSSRVCEYMLSRWE